MQDSDVLSHIAPPLPEVLDDHRYAVLTTFRRTGRAVTTPIWFAVAEGRVYFRTGTRAGKAKRLRRNNRVRVAAATARGRPLSVELDAAARLLGPEESGVARRALERRYGIQLRLFNLVLRLMRETPIFFELTAI
jgi:PPOX class probable F420-dependent enzyme